MTQTTVHSRAESHLERGMRLYKLGNYQGAIEEYQHAINIESDKAKAYTCWGDLLFRRGEYKDAVGQYLRAIAVDSTAVDYDKWVRALDYLTDEGRQAEVDAFAKCAGTDPKYAIAYRNWAQALVTLRRSDEADEKFKQALALNAQHGDANKQWGDSLYQRGEYSSAVKQYLAALETDPSLLDGDRSEPDSQAYGRWQKALDQLGQDERAQAEKKFHQIAQKHPANSLFRKWADALVELDRFNEANEKYKKAEEIHIQDASIYRSHGDAFYRQGRYQKALEQYLEAIKIKPSAVNYKQDLAAINYEWWVKALGEVGRRTRNRVVDEVRRVPSAEKSAVYRQWGEALFVLGKCNEACEQFVQAVAVNESDFETYNKWGLALVELGRYSEASKKYQRATDRPNGFAEAYVNWGNLHYKQKKYRELVDKYLVAMAINHIVVDYDKWVSALKYCGVDEREEIAEKLWKLAKGKPAFAGLYYKWGGALTRVNDHKGALVQYRKAAELAPVTGATYVQWADSLAKLEHWLEAIGLYLKALQDYAERVSMPELASRLRELFPKLVPALDHLKGPRRERVLEKINEIASESSHGAEVYHQWGNSFYHLGRLDDAVEMYYRAMELDHDYAKSTYNCGAILQEQKRYDEAREKYQAAIEIEPDESSNYSALGNVLLEMKNYEGAIEKYQHASCLKQDVDTYIRWGLALSRANDYEAALKKYEEAAEFGPKSARVYFGWGNILAELGRYDEAYAKFKKAIQVEPDDLFATFSAHNIAEFLFRQGKYAEGRRAWKEACQAYERTKQSAKEQSDKEYFQYYGNVLQAVFGNLDEAEKIYFEGLELDRNHVGILRSLSGLYLEKKDESRHKDGDVPTYWKAREASRRAYNILTTPAAKADSSVPSQLGELLLALGDYMTGAEEKAAQEHLLKALAKDPKSADILTNLGVLSARKKDFKEAIQYFSDALTIKPQELNIWSNLAEAYLRAAFEEKADPASKEMAEKEFKRILEIAPNHVESIIGLGEVYKAMGDVAKDEDLYLQAIDLFLKAIRIADSSVGSKKLKRKELAAAYYSIGYSKVKLYEAAKPARGGSLLHEARDYFSMSFNSDPANYKAKSAVEKLDKRLTLSSSRLVDTLGPWLIFGAAISIFIMAQTTVIGKQPPFKDLEAGYYVLLSFGALLFAIAGLYLPQLLKLKVAGIELEKNAVDQIATPGGLGINK